MKKVMISPNFDQGKLDTNQIDDWVEIVEDRVVGWIFDQTKFLLKNRHHEYAVCHLLMSYSEGIMAYQKGQDSTGRSKPFFIDGFVSVFQSSGFPVDFLKRVAEILYQDARCGFFHDNMFKRRIHLADSGAAINANVRKINGKIDPNGEITAVIIDARVLLQEVEKHFQEYLRRLRDPNNHELRDRFTAFWKRLYPDDREVIELGDF